MKKIDLLVQLSYHITFSAYGGLPELRKKSCKELKELLISNGGSCK